MLMRCALSFIARSVFFERARTFRALTFLSIYSRSKWREKPLSQSSSARIQTQTMEERRLPSLQLPRLQLYPAFPRRSWDRCFIPPISLYLKCVRRQQFLPRRHLHLRVLEDVVHGQFLLLEEREARERGGPSKPRLRMRLLRPLPLRPFASTFRRSREVRLYHLLTQYP